MVELFDDSYFDTRRIFTSKNDGLKTKHDNKLNTERHTLLERLFTRLD